MKNFLIFLFCLALLGAGWYAVDNHYKEIEHQRNVKVIASLERQKANETAQRQQYNDTVEERDELRKQCEIGIQAWDQLTTAVKAKVAKPDCELSFR